MLTDLHFPVAQAPVHASLGHVSSNILQPNCALSDSVACIRFINIITCGGRARGREKRMKTKHRADTAITDQDNLGLLSFPRVDHKRFVKVINTKLCEYTQTTFKQEENQSNLSLYKSRLLISSQRPHTYTFFQIPIIQPKLQN